MHIFAHILICKWSQECLLKCSESIAWSGSTVMTYFSKGLLSVATKLLFYLWFLIFLGHVFPSIFLTFHFSILSFFHSSNSITATYGWLLQTLIGILNKSHGAHTHTHQSLWRAESLWVEGDGLLGSHDQYCCFAFAASIAFRDHSLTIHVENAAWVLCMATGSFR